MEAAKLRIIRKSWTTGNLIGRRQEISTKGTVLFISMPWAGGLAHYANDFCNALVPHFPKVVLLTLAPFEIPKQFRSYYVEEVAKKQIRNKIAYVANTLRSLVVALRITHQEHPTLVIINGYQPVMSWWYRMLRPAKVPIFCIQHEVEPRLGSKAVSWFQRDFYRRVPGLIVHRYTDACDVLVKKYGVRRKIIQIDHGVYGSDIFGRDNRPQEAVESTMLSFGAVRPDKGVNVLLQAYPGATACAGLKLRIVGKAVSGYANKIETLITQHSHKGDIEWFNDYIPLKATAEYYQKAAVVVLPFIVGRQSGTLRLALFFGKPVIVTDTGELPHLVKKYGFGLVVPPNDVEALRAALVELSNNASLRQELAAKACIFRDGPNLSWATIVGDLLKHLSLD